MVELRARDLRFFRTAGALFLLLNLGTSCHDHSALEKQLADLRKDLQQIRTVQSNNGIMLEDMDNRVLLLHDQVDSNRLMLGTGAPPPALPVIRLQPSTSPIYPSEAVRRGEAPMPGSEPIPASPVVAVEPRPEPSKGAIQFQMLDEYGNILAAGDGTDPGSVPGAVTGPAPMAAAERSPATKKSDDNRALSLYKKGMALLKEKRHGDAVAMFEDFLSQFPRHGYADNCTYWIGEAYYDRQMYHKALAHFEQVVVQYPRGNKVPDAMLKAAFCYTSLGIRDRAGELFEKLIRTYPGTAAARLAEKRKAELL